MTKPILIIIGLCLSTLSANASLLVNCIAKGNISTQLMMDGPMVNLQVSKNKAIVYTATGGAIYNEKWNSITIDGTNQTELNGVKIYFESSRADNKSASIRPYGSTTEILYPGTEGIVVAGMTCDHSYQSIHKEVVNNN